MLLSEKKQEMFWAWINEKTNPVCPDCGKIVWNIGEMVAFPIVHSGENAPPGASIPAIYKSCDNCGRIIFYSAQTMGFIDLESRRIIDD